MTAEPEIETDATNEDRAALIEARQDGLMLLLGKPRKGTPE